MTVVDSRSAQRNLLLATVSFALCFMGWGLISAFAPLLQARFAISDFQTGMLVAFPVLLGALARIPMGWLTDRFGGRLVFASLMIFSAVPIWGVPLASSFAELLALALLMGMAGSSFAVGVGHVSRWTSPERQGTALGLYGLGNLGQSLAVFGGPLLAMAIGWENAFRLVAITLAAAGLAFALLARDAAGRPGGPPGRLGSLLRSPFAWYLSSFYFLTFGGMVAFGIYLPTLLKNSFQLAPADAGFRAAGFVLLATLMRPVGGWLADRIGGARVLAGVFLGVVPFALLLAWPSLIPFTVGALGCAALLGLGNGAVFNLVPRYFPAETGSAAGLVGAVGGLGGFFPPLLLGLFQDLWGMVWPAFLLLSGLSLLLWGLNQRVFLAQQATWEDNLPTPFAQLRAVSWATMTGGLLAAAIVVGSRNLQNFDPALVVYTFAALFALWGVVYHFAVWLQKPPTQLLWRRGWQLAKRPGALAKLAALVASHLLAQLFVVRRSRLRWIMHQLLFWGTVSAAAVTFPLVFGWIHFRSLPGDQMVYVAYLFGFPTGRIALATPVAWLTFHVLDLSALLVLAGVGLALWRRLRDRGAQAVQTFAMDFVPLVMLFAVSLTGLALTVSQIWLDGILYPFLGLLHAITVVALLLFLPFGKFFHIFQRPAQLGVKLYQAAGEAGEKARCARCQTPFAPRLQIEDLKGVLPRLGFDYVMDEPAGHWQAFCPACKRKKLAIAQKWQKESGHGPAPTVD